MNAAAVVVLRWSSRRIGQNPRDIKFAAQRLRYCVEQGCAYEQGDTLCEVETEEKIVPFKAERDGVCATYLLEEGTTISIGDALFVRNDCLALKDVPLDKTIKQIPARFGVELKNCLRCALEKDPRDRATCEEMFYLLEPSRAQRRHNVIELRPKIAQLLDLGTGGYEEEALPLAGRIDREEAEKERQRVAEEEAQKRREEEELRKQDPENTPEVVQKPKVKLISALLAARFTSRATGEDDGGDLEESELTEAQRMKRRRAEFEASLSPEALAGWKRALARVEKANRKKWYDNLPGVRRRRIDRRRERRLRVREYRRKIKIARRAALMNFWELDDVVKWAKLACRRAVDCEALSLQNRDGWYQLKLQRDKERAAAERARNRRARHRKLAAAKAGEAVEEEEEVEEVEEVVDNKKDDRKSIMGRQVIPPSETLRLTQCIEEARRTRDDRRRRLRKAITDNYAERKLENYALAAAAAVDLVWLDHAALRYCEPLGQCLIDKGVTGKKLHFAMQRAAENAERGIKRLSAKGTLDDEASCRQALGVAAVCRSEALKDVLTETVILAEKMRAPPKQKKEDSSSSDSDSDDDANKVHPEAHEERDRQAFILAVVLYAAFHETKTKALPARVDASTRIASVARGRQTRAVIKEIWRQADVLADDELRADAAAKAALAAEEARRPKPLPPPPPPLETMQFGARYAVLGLGHVLRKVGERAAQATKGRSDDPLSQTKAEPMSIMGWKGSDPPVDDSTCPHVLYFELGPLEDDEPGTEYPIIDDKEDPLAARIDDLKPATTYLAILKFTPRTRRRMVRACGRGEGATRCLPPEDDDENLQTRCVSFRTLPDVPEPPKPPKVRASRFRGAADLANLIAPYGTEKDSLAAMGAAVRPPHENTVAVKIAWVPPHDNGAPIKGYRVERAKAFRKNNRAPIAEANWTQVRALKHDERDITDVPPTDHRLYWYRILCHNKVGISDPGVASKIDLTDEATELHPHLRPLSLEVEAPAPAPSLLEVPSALAGASLLEASVASRPSKLLAVEAVASLLEAPEAVAPPAPAPEAPDVIPSPRPLPKLKRAKKRSEPTGGVLDGGVFFTPLKTAKPLPRSKVKSTFR